MDLVCANTALSWGKSPKVSTLKRLAVSATCAWRKDGIKCWQMAGKWLRVKDQIFLIAIHAKCCRTARQMHSFRCPSAVVTIHVNPVQSPNQIDVISIPVRIRFFLAWSDDGMPHPDS